MVNHSPCSQHRPFILEGVTVNKQVHERIRSFQVVLAKSHEEKKINNIVLGDPWENTVCQVIREHLRESTFVYLIKEEPAVQRSRCQCSCKRKYCRDPIMA